MLTADIWTSALEHAVIAVIIQLMLWPVFTLWSSGAIAVAILWAGKSPSTSTRGVAPRQSPGIMACCTTGTGTPAWTWPCRWCHA